MGKKLKIFRHQIVKMFNILYIIAIAYQKVVIFVNGYEVANLFENDKEANETSICGEEKFLLNLNKCLRHENNMLFCTQTAVRSMEAK